jgi:hypothetical protein
MIFKSPLLSQASGSLAGNVFSHNQGGMYMRARATPTNPNTEAQQAVRDGMRNAVFTWSNTLSDGQRDGWNTYAFNTPTFNRLGEATHKTGQQMFIRGYVPRAQAALGTPTTAPIVFNLGDFTPPTVLVADVSMQQISFGFNAGEEWATENGSALLVYMGRPQNATRIYGKGPYQLASMVLGDSMTPPTSPHTFAPLFAFALGQRIFLKFTATRLDGRLSSPTMMSVIATA